MATSGTDTDTRWKQENADDFKNYIDFMTPQLKINVFEILLLCNEKDYKEAENFKKEIEETCIVTHNGEFHSPKVILERDLVLLVNDPVRGLGEAFCKALFIFLFVTQEFCDCVEDLFKAHAYLRKALKEKKWSIVPIHTEDKVTRKQKCYELPDLLDGLHPISYWDKCSFMKSVEDILKSKMDLFDHMRKELDEEREKHFYENKRKLKRRRQQFYNSFGSATTLPAGVKKQELKNQNQRTKDKKNKDDPGNYSESSEPKELGPDDLTSPLNSLSLE